jgi:hypothetical protein
VNLEHLGRAGAKQNLSDDGNDFLPLLPWPRYKRWLRITVVGVSRLETEKGQDIHQRAGIPDLAKLWRGAEPKEILKECTKIGCRDRADPRWFRPLARQERNDQPCCFPDGRFAFLRRFGRCSEMVLTSIALYGRRITEHHGVLLATCGTEAEQGEVVLQAPRYASHRPFGFEVQGFLNPQLFGETVGTKAAVDRIGPARIVQKPFPARGRKMLSEIQYPNPTLGATCTDTLVCRRNHTYATYFPLRTLVVCSVGCRLTGRSWTSAAGGL